MEGWEKPQTIHANKWYWGGSQSVVKKKLKLYMLSYAIKGVALIIGFYFFIELLYPDYFLPYYLNN